MENRSSQLNHSSTYSLHKKPAWWQCQKRKSDEKPTPKRVIKIGLPSHTYPDNKIQTSKYNWLTFVPYNLCQQFCKSANLYFLIIGILQMLPLTTTTKGTPVVYFPLSVILGISMIKDFLEDNKKRKADKRQNNQLVHVYRKGTAPKFFPIKARDLRVGDLIKVENQQFFPADIVFLYANEQQKQCYLDTKNLDGESNLKVIVSPNIFDPQQSPSKVSRSNNNSSDSQSKSAFSFSAQQQQQITSELPIVHQQQQQKINFRSIQFNRLVYEGPSPVMHQFNGYFEDPKSGQKILVDEKNLIKKGTQLQNTDWAIGVVVYTGHETKIMLNSIKSQYKLSHVEMKLNQLIRLIFYMLFSICIMSSIFYAIIYELDDKTISAYLSFNDPNEGKYSSPTSILYRIPQWFLILSGVVPISLVVNLEMVRFIQGILIAKDDNMKSSETQENTIANSTNLNEELGQIQYIFTDKTGTLTTNQMMVRCLTVGDMSFGTFKENYQVGKSASFSHYQNNLKFQQSGDSYLSSYASHPRNPSYSKSNSSSNSSLSSNQSVQIISPQEFQSQLVCQLQNEDSNKQEKIKILEIFECINLCHSVSVMNNGKRQIFQATSPDEQALLNFTKQLGNLYVGKDSSGNRIIECAPNKYLRSIINDNIETFEQFYDKEGFQKKTFKILVTLDFTFQRKRMSIIVEDQNGVITLYSKGADNVMLGLAENSSDSKIKKTIEFNVKQYAESGMRTLVFAKKVLTQEQLESWLERYYLAQFSRVQGGNPEANKEANTNAMSIEQLQWEIESGMQLIGAAAIEDKLQEDAHKTIASLKQAGISIWMLTGDKIETAINVGYSCCLLNKKQTIIKVVHDEDRGNIIRQFQEAKQLQQQLSLNSQFSLQSDSSNSSLSKGNTLSNTISSSFTSQQQPQQKKMALIISGEAFQVLLDLRLERSFMECALQCSTVLACRVTPLQKQIFIQLTKKYRRKAVTMAVGDGANDVSMINEAHVGVGIRGREGREAANASDFAIGEFRFLRRLIFYTGRECYRKNSYLIFYNFYKNLSYTLCTFWFGFFSHFSGQYIFNQWLGQQFNLVFTAVPIILFALYDEEYPSGKYFGSEFKQSNYLENHPEVYRQRLRHKIFTSTNFWIQSSAGAVHAYFLMLLGYSIFEFNFIEPDGYTSDIFLTGMLVFSGAVLINNIKVILISKSIYGFTILSIILSILAFPVSLWFFSHSKKFDTFDYFNRLFSSGYSYLAIGLMLVCTSGFEIAISRYMDFSENEEFVSKKQKFINEEMRRKEADADPKETKKVNFSGNYVLIHKDKSNLNQG